MSCHSIQEEIIKQSYSGNRKNTVLKGFNEFEDEDCGKP